MEPSGPKLGILVSSMSSEFRCGFQERTRQPKKVMFMRLACGSNPGILLLRLNWHNVYFGSVIDFVAQTTISFCLRLSIIAGGSKTLEARRTGSASSGMNY